MKNEIKRNEILRRQDMLHRTRYRGLTRCLKRLFAVAEEAWGRFNHQSVTCTPEKDLPELHKFYRSGALIEAERFAGYYSPQFRRQMMNKMVKGKTFRVLQPVSSTPLGKPPEPLVNAKMILRASKCRKLFKEVVETEATPSEQGDLEHL